MDADASHKYFHFLELIQVIDQKRVRVFHQGFQTPRKRWKHDAEGVVSTYMHLTQLMWLGHQLMNN